LGEVAVDLHGDFSSSSEFIFNKFSLDGDLIISSPKGLKRALVFLVKPDGSIISIADKKFAKVTRGTDQSIRFSLPRGSAGAYTLYACMVGDGGVFGSDTVAAAYRTFDPMLAGVFEAPAAPAQDCESTHNCPLATK